jgi:glucokinase
VEGKIRKALAEGAVSQVTQLAEENSTRITTRMVLQSALAGDKMCGNIVAELAHDLGVALANVINLFNPSEVVLDKSLESGGKLLLDQITRVIKGHALASFAGMTTLRFSQLGEEAGILGLGLAILEKRFETPAPHPLGFVVPRVRPEDSLA